MGVALLLASVVMLSLSVAWCWLSYRGLRRAERLAREMEALMGRMRSLRQGGIIDEAQENRILAEAWRKLEEEERRR